MSYIKDNFLLTSKSAVKLYEKYAKHMPIFDYHCHLSQYQLLEDKEFSDVFEVWLDADHYKWRLMRNYGVDEEYITGNKSNREKFIKYCTVLSTAFGNPLYHWSQNELEVFFDCKYEINEKNAPLIWEECNEYIRKNHITPSKLIEKANVKCIFTTNEVFDVIETFVTLAEEKRSYKVIPAFRADKIMNIEAEKYIEFLGMLEKLTHKIQDIDALEAALEKRLAAFKGVGSRACDIALERVYEYADRESADKVLKSVLSGNKLTEEDVCTFKSYLTYFLIKLYAKYDMTVELHMGAMRNNNSEMLCKLGLDTGYDSIAEDNSTKNLSRLMDRLNSEKALPRLILFNLNPKMNTEIMTLLGCFQDSSAKGKIQYGAAWWFLDNKDGMETHLKDMSRLGHIATFAGMLTDSRSLLSYPRHHYFRRILCNFLGKMMDEGEMTKDIELVGKVVEDICYNNAVEYFKI